jgi:hypothetical protein
MKLYVNTVQRSGTYYFSYLLGNYLLWSALIDGRARYAKMGAFQVDIPRALTFRSTNAGVPFSRWANLYLGIFYLSIWHGFIEGFLEEFQDFPVTRGISVDEAQKNKVIFVHRNPLDQAVSFFDYFTAPSYKYKDTHFEIYTSEFETAFPKLIQSYVRAYVSHKRAKEQGCNIHFLTYENLVIDPESTFRKAIEYIGVQVNEHVLKLAVMDSQPLKLKAMELSQKNTLAHDQRYQKGLSHIKNPTIGKWRGRLTDDQLEYAKSLFSDFGMKLEEEFNLGV